MVTAGKTGSLTAVERQDAGSRPRTAPAPDTMNSPEEPAPSRPTGWRFIAVWVAFAITFLLTVVLGIQVVLDTKGVG